MAKPSHWFCPDLYFRSVAAVDLDLLWARGIRGLIMDLDNTLVPWRSMEIPRDVAAWAAKARAMGFGICIASNTRRYRRLSIVADALDAVFVTGVSKPRPGGFRKSLIAFGLDPSQAAVIGDQLLTDMWGAHRAKIMGIYVDRLSDRELFITKFNRNLERVILRALKKSGTMPPRQG